jgi:hypothetical protein
MSEDFYNCKSSKEPEEWLIQLILSKLKYYTPTPSPKIPKTSKYQSKSSPSLGKVRKNL